MYIEDEENIREKLNWNASKQ